MDEDGDESASVFGLENLYLGDQRPQLYCSLAGPIVQQSLSAIKVFPPSFTRVKSCRSWIASSSVPRCESYST